MNRKLTDLAQFLPSDEPAVETEVPVYIQEEAKRVSELICQKSSVSSLCFAALSDMHYPLQEAKTRRSILHAGMGIGELQKYVVMDFVTLLGDYAAGDESSSKSETNEVFRRIPQLLQGIGSTLPQIWLQGNHDRNPFLSMEEQLTPAELYQRIGSHTTKSFTVSEYPERMFGYTDFEDRHIRVIYLNSSDITGGTKLTPHMFSPYQLRWLAETALPMHGKAAPSQWGIILLSHMPLYWQPHGILELIEGFLKGTKGVVAATEGESVSFDFTGTERAELLCCINGHTHNFISSRLCGDKLLQISVPQLCDARYNEYGLSRPADGGELDKDGNPIYHYKEENSSRSTSFNLFVIDRENRKIHAICFGAGIDRTWDY